MTDDFDPRANQYGGDPDNPYVAKSMNLIDRADE